MLKVLVFMPVLGAGLVAILPGRFAGWLWRLALLFALAALGYSFWLAAHFDPLGPAIQMHAVSTARGESVSGASCGPRSHGGAGRARR